MQEHSNTVHITHLEKNDPFYTNRPPKGDRSEGFISIFIICYRLWVDFIKHHIILYGNPVGMTQDYEHVGTQAILLTCDPGNTEKQSILITWEPGNTGKQSFHSL